MGILGGVDKEEVRRAYNRIGGRIYELRYGEEQERKFTAALSRVSLSQEDLILDMGCGTGLLLEKFCEGIGFAVGLDLSLGLLSWARLKLKEAQNTGFIISDADHIPFKPATFDKLFAITLFQNLPNPRRTLSEAMKVTKTEAIIIVSGLKKKYSEEEFTSLISSVGLKIKEFVDNELKDYVAICGKKF